VRRWWIVAVFAMVGGGVAAGIAVLKPRKYTSQTVLLYREGVDRSYIQGNDAARAEAADEGMRLREMMLARARLQQIIDEFGLVPSTVRKFGYVEAVDEIRKQIDFRMRGGDTIHIAFTSSDPDTAQKVAARLADILIEENARLQIEQAEGTKSFLETTKKKSQEELTEKQRSYAEFLARHPEFAQDTIVTTGAAGAAVIAAKKRGESNGPRDPVVARLENQRERLKRLLTAKTGGDTGEEAGVQIDPALASERSASIDELAEAKRNLSEKLSQYTEAHPDVQTAKRRLAAAEERAKRAREAVFAAEAVRAGWKKIDPATIDKGKVERELNEIERDLANARDRVKSKGESTASDGSSKVYSSIVNLETEWQRLNRDLNDAREKVDQLDTIEFRASMFATSVTSGNSSQMVVIDPAFKPMRPTGAGRAVITIVGLVVAMALGSALALTLAMLDDRFYEGADVERAGVAPLLITIPKRTRWRRRG
jgi:uncharacterized protein involved in exopolysaccharide biosynthesis